MWPIVIVWFLSTLGWGFGAWVLQMFDSKMGRHDPTTTAVRLAAAVSIVGLVVSAARRRALRTASRLAYWSVAAPGWILLIAFAIIWLLLLVALSAY